VAEKKEKQYVSDNAQLMAEWDWERNSELGMDPPNLTCGSHKKVWWKCDKGHEWQAVIGSRNNGCGCPYCSGCLPIKGQNDLQAINPILAKEWNYDKNYGLTPLDVLPIGTGRLLGRGRMKIKKRASIIRCENNSLRNLMLGCKRKTTSNVLWMVDNLKLAKLQRLLKT